MALYAAPSILGDVFPSILSRRSFVFGTIPAVIAGLLASAADAIAAPSLSQVAPLGGPRYELRGEFGPPCSACEVIVDYGGLRYAYAPKPWHPQRLSVELADLNRGTNLRVRVRAQAGLTNAVPVALERKLVPPRELQQPVPRGMIDSQHYFERTHELAVGEKGEDVFDVGVALPSCGARAEVFDHARIVYTVQRFAQAQVVASPPAGCTRCPPLRVRWYNEPTGRLVYQLHVYRRTVEGVCRERVR